MQNKLVRFGPVALTTTLTTNVLNPPATTGGVGCGTPNTYIAIHHVRISNKTGSNASYSFWLGATGANAAGTEVIGTGKVVPPNDYIDWYPARGMRLDVADFLVGGSNTATALTFEAEGEIGIA